MKLTNLLKVVVAIGALAFLSACDQNPRNFVEGEIVVISSNMSNIERNAARNGLVSYSNETVKFGNGLVIRVETDDSTYVIQVDPTDMGGSNGPQTIISLAGALEIGSRVRFPTEFSRTFRHIMYSTQKVGFSKSKIGILDPDDIELLPPSE